MREQVPMLMLENQLILICSTLHLFKGSPKVQHFSSKP